MAVCTSSGRCSPFRRLAGEYEKVAVIVDGEAVEADAKDTVASLLLACGRLAVQANKVSGQPRGAFCMMGVCFECLVTIDDVPDMQGCMVSVREGMRITTQLDRLWDD